MSVLIGVACEDNGHFSVATRLIDRSLLSAYDWLDGILDDCRSWCGMREGERWYKYDPEDANDIRPIEIDGRRIAPHGPIRGEPLKPEAGMWRRILLLFCHLSPRPDVIVLARDMDGYPKRREGIEQACGLPWPFPVVVAAPEPEIEAWIVSGFSPCNPSEKETLKSVRALLSFDPTLRSHNLTSHPNDAKTDAKRVLERLTGDDLERQDACLLDQAQLRLRGTKNGLVGFLDDIDHCIVPLFRGTP